MSVLSHPLDFEKPIVELDSQLETLRDQVASGDKSKRDEFAKIEQKLAKVRNEIYKKLTPYQRVQLSRHFDRPFTLDFVNYIFTDFVEFHGDRLFRDDPAIVGGTAKLGGKPVMLVGHQRGRSMNERLARNFGMPNPEGYRKALRFFEMAEKFNLPLITFIDTQGAFPGLEAEERGQAEAIARNLKVLANISIPVISVVIGEGGSGGALALGVSNKILMLEYACYSVITPEGCASILFHSDSDSSRNDKASRASEMLKITAVDLKSLGVADEIIQEPPGGAHYNHKEAAEFLRTSLVRNLEELSRWSKEEIIEGRYKKFRNMAVFTEES